MEKTDTRKLSPETQAELRKLFIRLRNKGMSNKQASETIGINPSRGSIIWKKYKAGGLAAIKIQKRGRNKGSGCRLSPDQEAIVRKMLIDKTPDQLKFPFALWSRDAVCQAIKREFKIDIPLRTITDYLKRWGFTPQKPTKRAYEQCPNAVKKWLDSSYPEIAARAKAEKAEIHWGDETGVQSNAYNAKGFAPKGQTPIIRLNAKKSSINMISSITNKGKVRFMLYKETMTSKVFIKFLSRLAKNAERKVFLILDNHRVHHSKSVKAWLEKHTKFIELFFLPSYSPELNPDEFLNGNLKQKIRSGLPSRTQQDLIKKTRSFMKTLQKRPDHVKGFFKNHKVAYAA